MPTYTYRCSRCGREEDRRESFTASLRFPCTTCLAEGRKGEMERAVVYAVSFSGFARTPASERDWSGDFKSYQEANHEIDYRKGRLEDAMQKRLPEPPIYQKAKAKARDLISKGAKDANDLP